MSETKLDLQKLRELEAADPRRDERWMEGQAGSANIVAFGGDDVSPVASTYHSAYAPLIAALRNAAPALLAAAEERDRLRAESTWLREALATLLVCVRFSRADISSDTLSRMDRIVKGPAFCLRCNGTGKYLDSVEDVVRTCPVCEALAGKAGGS